MDSQSGREEKVYDFGHFLAVVRERWWVVVLTMAVIGGLALGASLLLAARYSATAELAYSSDAAQLASQALSSAGTTEKPHNISNDALTLQTSAFADRVKKAMGTDLSAADLRSAIKVTSDSALDVINIKASGSDANLVANIANTFANEFVKQRQEDAAAALAQAQQLLKGRIDSLSAEEAASAYGLDLKRRYDDLAVLLSMEIKDYKVLQPAIAPLSPYFPRPFLDLELGLFVGLILGLVLAFLLDYLDRRIKDQSVLERVMNLPIIGTVPLVSRRWSREASSSNPAVGFREGNEALLESMRMLRSNLKVLGFGDSRRSVLVTSAAPGEGKSTLAVNLALSMALAGDRVVLVDADLRNPTIHQYLGIPNTQGLGDALLDRDSSWSTKIQAVDLSRFVSPRMGLARKSVGKDATISKFLCLTSGPALSNPSEVLESTAMSDVLAELQGISDYVILDGPPMLIASDSLILAQGVDALILASRLGRETGSEAFQVRQLLDRAEVTALGIVICGAKPQSREGYYYYHRADQSGEAPVRRGS
jgi:capsular exopolysaccharide synthesis family protein